MSQHSHSNSNSDLNSETKFEHYDIVIVGGGTVGCSLALALTQLTEKRQLSDTFRIAIVEAQAYQANQPHPGFDGRAIALARQSLDFLYQLGLQEEIDSVTEAIKHIHVSDQGFGGQCELDAAQLKVSALGRVIELHDFGRILHSALQTSSAQRIISWHCPDQVTEINTLSDSVEMTLLSGTKISTKLLLATDGGESGTRQLLQVEPEIRDYQQVALITNIKTSEAHNNRAFERFTENGPLAFLPMTDNRCSVVWTVAQGQESDLLAASEDEFKQRLQAEFGYRLGEITQIGLRSVYPLRLVQCQSHHLHRAALLGNAAQTLHPIAGQGFNLGIRDVQDLTACLENALQNDHDIGDHSVLRAFRQRRQIDASTTIAATHGLVNLFSSKVLPSVMTRNIGLLAMHLLPFVKSRFAQRAMGRRS